MAAANAIEQLEHEQCDKRELQEQLNDLKVIISILRIHTYNTLYPYIHIYVRTIHCNHKFCGEWIDQARIELVMIIINIGWLWFHQSCIALQPISSPNHPLNVTIADITHTLNMRMMIVLS